MRRIGVRGKEVRKSKGEKQRKVLTLFVVNCQRKKRRQERESEKTGKRNACRDGKGKNNWLNRCVKTVVFPGPSLFFSCMHGERKERVGVPDCLTRGATGQGQAWRKVRLVNAVIISDVQWVSTADGWKGGRAVWSV